MKILKYSYICMFAATAGIMTACAPDGQEGMFPGKGEPVTVKFSIDTRGAGADSFDSQVKTLRVYAFQDGSPVGYYYGGEDVQTHIFEWKLPQGEVWFYAVANEQAAGELLSENKGDIFVLPGETAGGVRPVEGLEVTPDKLESLTFGRLPEAEYVSGGTETGKDETEKQYRSAIVPMTGKHRETVTHDNQEINLVLKRSVAKLNLYFAKADVADAGAGQLYMGRGLYLYNMPEYGYLFPKEKYEYTGNFNCLEGAGESSDSKNQKNGKVILSAGWPGEPENAPQEGTPEYEEYERNLREKTHINEIKALAHAGNADTDNFQWIPAKPVYLFANPNGIADRYPDNPSAEESKGYYLKILSHEHKVGSDGMEGHEGDMQYVALPPVEANTNLRLFSVISMHGHVGVTAHWMIVPWEPGGGDVVFE